MRTYIVHYWREKGDDCVDCEEIIKAEDIGRAFYIFIKRTKNVKRVYKIEETI